MTDLLHKTIEASERLTARTDVDEVVRELSKVLKKLVKSSWVAVYLLDREHRDFLPARSCGIPTRHLHQFRSLPLESAHIPLLRNLLRRKRHLLIPRPADSPFLPLSVRHLLRQTTLLAVPMVSRREILGVVFVARRAGHHPFDDGEIAIIRDMVSHAALVASHIRLFDESLEMALDVARRTDVILTLDEINRSISSSLSHERIIQTAMEQLERIINCELVLIALPDEEGLVVSSLHGSGFTFPPGLEVGRRLIPPCTACSSFERGEAVHVPTLADLVPCGAIDSELQDAGISSLLAIPLRSGSSVSGVLLLGDTEPGQFLQDDLFIIEKIAAQLAVALGNARLYEELRNLFVNTVASLSNAIDAKSPWTKGHSERVMNLSGIIGRECGMTEPEVERVRLGGLLHDIGKIGIMEALLEKPEHLEEDEFPPMRHHPEKGVAILAPISQLRDVLPGILHHHERFDGSGYPDRLRGEDIPLDARIIAVADAFDAMVSNRPYRRGLAAGEALEELERCAGSQFDPAVVARFAAFIRTTPS